ncbi:MAG: hypothetical protein ACK4I8_08875, partial [Armatimonadota bacterium]
DLSQANEVLGFTPVLPSWLPPGYVLEGIFALGEHRWKMAHMVYTDGIGVISVFQHLRPPKKRPPVMGQPFPPPPKKPFGPSPHGRPSLGGQPPHGAPPIQRLFPHRTAVREIGDLTVVLVSEVSREWLEKMANSLSPAAR